MIFLRVRFHCFFFKTVSRFFLFYHEESCSILTRESEVGVLHTQLKQKRNGRTSAPESVRTEGEHWARNAKRKERRTSACQQLTLSE